MNSETLYAMDMITKPKLYYQIKIILPNQNHQTKQTNTTHINLLQFLLLYTSVHMVATVQQVYSRNDNI